MPGGLGEFGRIAQFFAPLAEGFPGALGLIDDAALITPPPGRELAVTTDTMVAGVHFMGDEPPGLIAAKLLRVNLSDLASMGAAPLAYTLNIALPDSIDDDWLKAFAEGLAADQRAFDISLAGGDSVSTPGPACLTVTAMGSVEAGRALTRAGARDGDIVYVSGTIGDAALGLRAMRGELTGLGEEQAHELIGRYRLPRPRVGLGQRLIGLASAAVDISDGLVADLGHVLDASGRVVAKLAAGALRGEAAGEGAALGAEIEAATVPLSAAAAAALRGDAGLMETILTGGDDYELLFTVAPGYAGRVEALAKDLDLPLTPVGRITKGGGVRVIGPDGEPMRFAKAGWEHR
jgi:thiamine-monophosphate kinase